MKQKNLLMAATVAAGIGLFTAVPHSNATPLTTLLQISPDNAGTHSGLTLVHGRRVRGRHCRKAWHPRRGWHRHPRACRHKYRKRWRRHHRWERDKGCYFYKGSIHCKFF